MTTQFRDVTTDDGFGVADAHGFTLHDRARDMIQAVARGGSEYVLCRIDGEEVALFMTVARERRSALAAGKPASIAAVVFVDVPEELGMFVDAELGAGAEEPRERWAFAAMVAAFCTGSIGQDQPRYLVNGLGRATIEVTIEVDWDDETTRWHGAAKIL